VFTYSLPRTYYIFQRKKAKSPALTVPLLCHLTSCTPTKLFYTSHTLAIDVSDPDIYSLLSFQLPNLMSLSIAGAVPKDQSHSSPCAMFPTMVIFVVRIW
jgi:hypothetical protein